MSNGGILDLLLSNEIVGRSRYERMAQVAKKSTVTLVFDSEEMISVASSVAVDTNVEFRALVDVNVGQNRCGVDTKGTLEKQQFLAEI